jgi:hypothetical protein
MIGRLATRFNSRRRLLSFAWLSDQPISLPCPEPILQWEREHRINPDHNPKGCYFCGLPDRPLTAADRAKLTKLHKGSDEDAAAAA